ncbi:MAG: dihydrofolate reductase family protein [Patescibacteria group bacterium]
MRSEKINIKFSIIAAVTIDGKIAKNNHQFTDWTSPEDKDFLHQQLDKSDCVIVGNNTYKISHQPLSRRNCLVFTKSVDAVRPAGKLCLYVNPAKVNLEKLVKQKSYRRIAVLGGMQVYSWFLQQRLVDDIYLTIEPVIFGAGLSLFDVKLKKILKNFKLISVRRLNKTGTILLHYIKSNS